MNGAMKYQQGHGVKISAAIKPNASDEEISFLQQIGVNYCYTWIQPEQMNYDFISKLKERCSRYGITLFNIGIAFYGKSAAIQLGLPERDEHIDQFNKFIGVLSRADIHTTTITWEPSGFGALCTTADGQAGSTLYSPVGRGGSITRACDYSILKDMPFTHGRQYSRDEIWTNFEYFLKKVIPVAEKEEVRISLHPNDPPVQTARGISSLITCMDDYRKAFKLANSDFFGMELCVGCWLEGGNAGFGDIRKGIQEFVKANKVFIVHFRNVSGVMPYFVETFVDDGYADMYEIMKFFVKAGYNGTLVLDHAPTIAGQGENGEILTTAYSLGYIKALLQAAESENN
ncbi:mannonate dehydratase [Paenibacillus sp. LHD-38]|uniref:mannonate dehydratase n=1 Tax=Paenibacillus sp. LHD-38 TaxID=3072143 RepID=UPI00280FD620|nr:mannonate dehydratase [Paenibacillus sp. LHD-38]MDQ8736195.1 mannonate dehydratase [Paenibacillus sp. LHD-38]